MFSISLNPLYNKDLLTNVLSFLEPENIGRIQSVCKLWAQVVTKSEILWNPFCNKKNTSILDFCLNKERSLLYLQKIIVSDLTFTKWKEELIHDLRNFYKNSMQTYKDLKIFEQKKKIELATFQEEWKKKRTLLMATNMRVGSMAAS